MNLKTIVRYLPFRCLILCSLFRSSKLHFQCELLLHKIPHPLPLCTSWAYLIVWWFSSEFPASFGIIEITSMTFASLPNIVSKKMLYVTGCRKNVRSVFWQKCVISAHVPRHVIVLYSFKGFWDFTARITMLWQLLYHIDISMCPDTCFFVLVKIDLDTGICVQFTLSNFRYEKTKQKQQGKSQQHLILQSPCQ